MDRELSRVRDTARLISEETGADPERLEHRLQVKALEAKIEELKMELKMKEAEHQAERVRQRAPTAKLTSDQKDAQIAELKAFADSLQNSYLEEKEDRKAAQRELGVLRKRVLVAAENVAAMAEEVKRTNAEKLAADNRVYNAVNALKNAIENIRTASTLAEALKSSIQALGLSAKQFVTNITEEGVTALSPKAGRILVENWCMEADRATKLTQALDRANEAVNDIKSLCKDSRPASR